MTDLLIKNDGSGFDIAVENGDAVLTHTRGRVVEVTQRVTFRLMTWLGESAYDRAAGLPYLDGVFGFEPIEGVAALFTQEIVTTEGVDELEGSPEYLLDAGQTMAMNVSIRIGDDVADLALSIGAPT